MCVLTLKMTSQLYSSFCPGLKQQEHFIHSFRRVTLNETRSLLEVSKVLLRAVVLMV